MFVEDGSGWKPPQWEPPPRKPKITKRQELVILWVVGINAVLLLLAPLGGSTIVEALIAVMTTAR